MMHKLKFSKATHHVHDKANLYASLIQSPQSFSNLSKVMIKMMVKINNFVIIWFYFVPDPVCSSLCVSIYFYYPYFPDEKVKNRGARINGQTINQIWAVWSQNPHFLPAHGFASWCINLCTQHIKHKPHQLQHDAPTKNLHRLYIVVR